MIFKGKTIWRKGTEEELPHGRTAAGMRGPLGTGGLAM
jgi:hypothetical protein